MYYASNLLVCLLLLLHHTFLYPFILIIHFHPFLSQDQSTALFAEMSVWRILAQNSHD